VELWRGERREIEGHGATSICLVLGISVEGKKIEARRGDKERDEVGPTT
jgi:hypothetical protein